MHRRTFLLATLAAAGLPGLSLAGSPALDRRLVVVLLRGGLDGLAAVPPVGDPDFASLRPAPADAIPLDDTFALHPGLAPLRARWDARELAVVHAAAPPYRLRSHFDAQDVLENGTDRPLGARTGWLARALVAAGGSGLALGTGLPLLLRGEADTASLDPRHLPRPAPWLERVRDLYADDPAFATALTRGLDTAARFGRVAEDDATTALGAVLAADDGPRVAAFELGGFDTHTGQERTLAQRLPELATALEGLRTGLGAAWSRAVVLVVTEFGRTLSPNGTDGTDHGVGGVAWVVGGAVAGRVVGEWPGLAPADRLDGRDLRPTTDLRSLAKGVVGPVLGLGRAALDRDVFPGSAGVPAVADLVRTA